jgi:nicotinate-nucleotide pyrophosphorylase (carboxylating)
MYEYLSSSFQQWLAEDLGDGDHTSLSCIPAEAVGRSRLIVKESGIIAGVGVAHALFQFVDSSMQFFEYIHDGTEVKPGDIVFEETGKGPFPAQNRTADV